MIHQKKTPKRIHTVASTNHHSYCGFHCANTGDRFRQKRLHGNRTQLKITPLQKATKFENPGETAIPAYKGDYANDEMTAATASRDAASVALYGTAGNAR